MTDIYPPQTLATISHLSYFFKLSAPSIMTSLRPVVCIKNSLHISVSGSSVFSDRDDNALYIIFFKYIPPIFLIVFIKIFYARTVSIMPRVKRMFFVPFFAFFIAYLFFFLLKTPEYATKCCFDSVLLCISKVIPSLFPFFVLNEIIFSTGLSYTLGNKLGKFFSKLFGISNESSICFLSGCLFGFPLGTKGVADLLKKNVISREEGERLVCFCSNTGPAFAIGFVSSILGNTKAAFVIYLSQVLSAIIIGLVLRKKGENIPPAPTRQCNIRLSAIPKAIGCSVYPMLNVCAFVCFFSCVIYSVEGFLFSLNLNEYTESLITGFVEITNGISRLADLPVDNLSVWLCAFFVGWSGISVIMQSISIMSEHGLRYKKFLFSKLVQGVMCANLSVFLCKLFNLY